ncbi:hypothetical protein ACTCUG_09875 [Latilactobacillus sakei]|nr:hypothetical protein [Latilactobacillus sakei]
MYNKSITIKNIPERAYDYVVNGRLLFDYVAFLISLLFIKQYE